MLKRFPNRRSENILVDMKGDRSLGERALGSLGGRVDCGMLDRRVIRSFHQEAGLREAGLVALGSWGSRRIGRAGPRVNLDLLRQCHRVILAVGEGLQILLVPLLERSLGVLGQSDGRSMLLRVGEALDLLQLVAQSVDLLGEGDDLLLRL